MILDVIQGRKSMGIALVVRRTVFDAIIILIPILMMRCASPQTVVRMVGYISDAYYHSMTLLSAALKPM